MKKVKIGVIGAGRGESMIKYCRIAENAEIVAICDKMQYLLDEQKIKNAAFPNVAYYTDYDEFLKHDMDAVVLANYANEHAPFAIKALKAGKHVFSEVLPAQNMKEAVELIETVEQTGKIYAYGENYCYMAAPCEMRKKYREGVIGEFEYGEGEYIHNCEPIWPKITYGQPDHWRNNKSAFFYCTHSIGPVVHITGLRPKKVTGFEGTKTARNLRGGSKAGQFAVEMIEFENGGIYKSIHGGLYKNSIWYSLYGSMGEMESARECAENGDVSRIYINADPCDGAYGQEKKENYEPYAGGTETAKGFGHAGSDYYCMYNFVQKILGDEQADTIDVYEAMDMFLPGHFGYLSVLSGGIPMEIPDLRDKAQRNQYCCDTRCTNPKAAGEQLLPCFSKGNPDIPEEIYKRVEEEYLKIIEEKKK